MKKIKDLFKKYYVYITYIISAGISFFLEMCIRDRARYMECLKNVKKCGMEKKINVVYQDALELNLSEELRDVYKRQVSTSILQDRSLFFYLFSWVKLNLDNKKMIVYN